jgi:hypothetical protein
MYDAWSQGVSGLTLWRCGTATRGSAAKGAEGMGPFLLLSAVGPSQVVTFLRIDRRQSQRISAVSCGSHDSLAKKKKIAFAVCRRDLSTRRRRCSSVAVVFFAQYVYSIFAYNIIT